MNRFRLFVLAVAGFLAVVGESFFKKSIAVGLCGLLTFNSASCAGWGSGVSAAVTNPGEVSPSSTEIALPPRIRDAPVDLQDALADDFGIVSQNPFSTGRNEILFTSPSTGVEQKYSVNLPGTGDFQLFEVEFNKVSVPNPEKLVGEGNSIFTADQVANLLQSFQINFQNNQPSEVIFADGSKAEFSNSSYVFKLPSGEVVDSVTLSQGNLYDSNNVAIKRRIFNSKHGNYNYLASSVNACQSNVHTDLNGVSKDIFEIEKILRSIDAKTKELARWALAFGSEAVENSTKFTGESSREENIDAAYCRLPVECGQVQNYEGGSEIRTNLFHLQPGTNRTVNLDYEFYEIADRLEIYYNGEIRYTIPEPEPPKTIEIADTRNHDPSLFTGGSGRKTIRIDNGIEYVGVKLIGNVDEGTKWNYQISCSGEAIADAGPQCSTDNNISSLPNHIKSAFSNLTTQNKAEICITKILGINRWWATVGDQFDVNLDIHIEEKGNYTLFINTETVFTDKWKILNNATEWCRGIQAIYLGTLEHGDHVVNIANFIAPDDPVVEKITFSLKQKKDYQRTCDAEYILNDQLVTLFVADHKEKHTSDREYLVRLKESGVYRLSREDLIKVFAPNLKFNKGEDYNMPFDIISTWKRDKIKTFIKKGLIEQGMRKGDSYSFIDLSEFKTGTYSYQDLNAYPAKIYASILSKKNKLTINYYFHYPFSNWKEHKGYNDHEGDWEGITLFFDMEGGYLIPKEIGFGQHVGSPFLSDAVEKKDWTGESQNEQGEFLPSRQDVFVGLGGHASYSKASTKKMFTPGFPRLIREEKHQGDGEEFHANGKEVEYLPRIGDLNLNSTQGWLLYPGHWGSRDDSCNGDCGPRGPVFLDTYIGTHEFLGRGDRWLDPWGWVTEKP